MINNIQKKIEALVVEKRAFINGEYVNSLGNEIIEKVSPVDGRDLSGIQSCKKEDVDSAVRAAKNSFDSKIWLNLTLQKKKEIIFKLADLIEENREELALLDCLETGRSIKNYYYDSIPKAIESLRWFAESADKLYDKSISPQSNVFATITREPLGVVGLITPWNDPMVISAWKVAPALLMGNSIVIKPAEQSSFSILKVAGLTKDAGIPDGVFNVVTGYGQSAGKALALHDDVAGIFFTGSSATGKKILQYSGRSNMKKVGLECGGKSPFIISSKCCNLLEAASVLAKNIFYNQGQICSAPSRLIIDSSIKEKFIPLLLEEAKKYLPTDPFDMNSEVGCMVSQEQKDRVQSYLDKAKAEGLKNLLPAYDTNKPVHNGVSIVPVIFDNVDPDSCIAQEEIFGPVLVIINVDSIHEAVEIANNSRYGLAASIWTDEVNEAFQVSRELRAGIVHLNSYGSDDNTVPFGGIKESGIGKDKSAYAFDEYSIQKTIWMNFTSSNA